MSMRGVVIPAEFARPCRVIEWEKEDDLLGLLYREIDCRMVEAFTLLPDGTTVWVDEDGNYADNPVENVRAWALAAVAGLHLAGPLMGTAVLTGGPDEDGNATSLSDRLVSTSFHVIMKTVGGPGLV